MAFTPWFEFWRDWWRVEPRSCPAAPPCNLDDLTGALAEYLESAKLVAARAAKNVEDAERLMEALTAMVERKRQSGRH